MDLSGLSPDRAPPVGAPLGLFHLMPLFLGLAGLVLAWQGDQVLASRWTPAALAATHFVVLGALAPVMCGALLQVSPVLLGAPYPWVRPTAAITAAGLGVGGLLVGGGFLSGRPPLLVAGGIAAALGLAVFLGASYRALAGSGARGATRWAVRLAMLALTVTLALGLTLAAARLGAVTLPEHLRWVDVHVAWGLAGWVGLLLAGIGMELIPLFFISPAFPAWLRRMLPIAVFTLLVAFTLPGLRTPAPPVLLQYLIAALFLAYLLYNGTALYLQQRRRRPRRDTSLRLWQTSHAAVFAAFFAWSLGLSASLTGVLLIGAALSFVIGSLLKIVPFLTWLDLQQRRAADRRLQVALPRLRMLLPPAMGNAIALTLAGAILAVLGGGVWPPLGRFGGVLLVLCAILLGHALLGAARQRRAVLRALAASGEPPRHAS